MSLLKYFLSSFLVLLGLITSKGQDVQTQNSFEFSLSVKLDQREISELNKISSSDFYSGFAIGADVSVSYRLQHFEFSMGTFRLNLNNGLNSVPIDEGEFALNSIYFTVGYLLNVTDNYKIVPFAGLSATRYRYFIVDQTVVSSGSSTPLQNVNPNIVQLQGLTQDIMLGIDQSLRIPDRDLPSFVPSELTLNISFSQNFGGARHELIGEGNEFNSTKSLYSYSFQLGVGVSWRLFG